jgi:hypothetical protein
MSRKPTPKKPKIDWSQRTLLVNPDNGMVVQTSGNSTEKSFEATVVWTGKSPFGLGYYGKAWRKLSFSLYEGAVLLSRFPERFQVTAVDPIKEAK